MGYSLDRFPVQVLGRSGASPYQLPKGSALLSVLFAIFYLLFVIAAKRSASPYQFILHPYV
jgi:hypothetical protein